jgi:hypothetical protein
MNHVSLTGPEGYRDEEHEGRRKKEGTRKTMCPSVCFPLLIVGLN